MNVRSFRVIVLLALLALVPDVRRGIASPVLETGSSIPLPPPPPESIDDRCVVSVLNRATRARPDGSWRLDNIPSSFGPLRARATCLVDGVTFLGQSDLFEVQPGGRARVGSIDLDEILPVPTSLTLTLTPATLGAVGATAQATALAVFSDGNVLDVTMAAETSWVSSNPAVVTVGENGIVTAVGSGSAIITVLHEAVSAFAALRVVLAGADMDGDGIPDDVELANGMNPNDPVDAEEDPDGDGLSSRDELLVQATDPQVADSDADGIADGEEVRPGADGYRTNPRAADTDGDGVRDGREIEDGTDPTDPTDFNLGGALTSIEVSPAAFSLTLSTVLGTASRQLTVTGRLQDGTTVDVTSTSRGTTYTSSDLSVCFIGPPDGRVFAGSTGTCTVTVAIGALQAQVVVTVERFLPVPLSFVGLPGHANAVEVRGDFAFVAAGAAGLVVVDVRDRTAPRVLTALPLAGNANDLRIVGDRAYVAVGSAGLAIVSVADPSAPALLGTVDTPGDAQDVAVAGMQALVADATVGLVVIDATDPASPAVIGSVATPTSARAVAAVPGAALAVVGDYTSGQIGGLRVVDLTDPAAPAIVGNLTQNSITGIEVAGGFAYVANADRLIIVDLADPQTPVKRAEVFPLNGGHPSDVALAGPFLFGAPNHAGDRNTVPIIDVGVPTNPLVRAAITFGIIRADRGTGIAADGNHVYLTSTTADSGGDNGTTGDTRLYIGQYLAFEDTAGVPPTVEITAPVANATVIEGCPVPVTVAATDDVTVVAVELLENGAPGDRDTGPPYDFMVTVPAGAPTLVLGARATDAGGNTGTADDVPLMVVADPRTTATGLVQDSGANPLAGAEVRCHGVTGATGGDGRFAIANVPTCGDVRCTATWTGPEGTILQETSGSAAPVGGATTDVGTIALRPFSFAVNTTADGPDGAAGDGRCETGAGNQVCTLRAALEEANALAGAQEVRVPAGTYTLAQAATCLLRAQGSPSPSPFTSTSLCVTGATTIVGSGAATTIVDGAELNHALLVGADASVEVRGLTLRRGREQFGDFPFSAGGVLNNQGTLIIRDSVVREGSVGPSIGSRGVGIFNQGTLTLLDSVVANNGVAGGDAVLNLDGTLAIVRSVVRDSLGVGIYQQSGISAVFGTLAITDSAIIGNAGGGLTVIHGGAILTNVTVSGNSSNSCGAGINNSAAMLASNVTVTGNTSTNGGGGVCNGGTFILRNTILAGNTAPAPLPDCAGGRPLVSQGYNLVAQAMFCLLENDLTGNLLGVDPLLGPLADNGGPTPTHALLPGSPAIDAGEPGVPGSGGTACAATDQRGVARPQPPGGACDMGAYEAIGP